MLIEVFQLITWVLLDTTNSPLVVRDRIDQVVVVVRYNLPRMCTWEATVDIQFVTSEVVCTTGWRSIRS